ncbi:MAG: hypothetical protein OXJ52_05800 [Oligoflexia bacterium]|nr:hypothetical protein [Oligoflexia bacterium]
MAQASSKSWQKIFDDYNIHQYAFEKGPFYISANQIKTACQNFKKTGEKEVRILCTQTKREDRPDIFKEKGLFLLPIRNGLYCIVKGEGYVDVPNINKEVILYKSKLSFDLDTSKVGQSEMQHLDYAYASSLIKTFVNDDSLVLTIRGRKYTEKPFEFFVNKQKIQVTGVQTEVDAGYEGEDKVVLIEAKNIKTDNVIIRQMYYPFMKWKQETNKQIINLFFQKEEDAYSIWQFELENKENYNSVKLKKARKFKIN